MRYTSSGQTIPEATKRQFDGGSEWEDAMAWRAESFIAAIENTHQFSAAVSLESIVSFDSEDFFLATGRRTQHSSTDIRQRSYSFSENELFVRSIVSYEPSEKLKTAVGLEYSYDWLGDNWGDSDSFHARAGKQNFFSKTSAYNDVHNPDLVLEYNDGWDAHTYFCNG